jgi:hypothetical protein
VEASSLSNSAAATRTAATSSRAFLSPHPLQERHPYLRDCGGVFRSLGILLQKLDLHNLQPVLQPPVVGLQGFDESVQGIVLVPVPVVLGAQLIETVVPLSSPALQLLSAANKVREKAKSGNARAQRRQGKTLNSTMRTRTLKICHAGPAWIRRASFNALLSEAPWSQNSCHSACSAWASLK